MGGGHGGVLVSDVMNVSQVEAEVSSCFPLFLHPSLPRGGSQSSDSVQPNVPGLSRVPVWTRFPPPQEASGLLKLNPELAAAMR